MKNVVITGNFDGVHNGHRYLFARAIEFAEKEKFSTLAFTFSEHPGNYFHPETPIKCLTPTEEKRRLILACGIDGFEAVPFGHATAERSPGDFLDFLKRNYNCGAIVCGSDFRFGKNREGGVENIEALASEAGIKCLVVDLQSCGDETVKIGSTRIRSAVEQGDMSYCFRTLGRLYSVSGKTIHGKGMGTLWGFPTINTEYDKSQLLPKFGVYASFVKTEDAIFLSVTDVGIRPSVGDGDEPTVETHIIRMLRGEADIDMNFYGKNACVGMAEYLREEKIFDSPEALCKAIEYDKQYTETHFGGIYKKFVNY